MKFLMLRRYKNMIIISIFFFYLGCGITFSFFSINCANAVQPFNSPNLPNVLTKIEYAVLILSSPNNELKRDAIRTTWMNFVDNIFVENGEILYKWNHTRTREPYLNSFVRWFFVIGTQGLTNDKLKTLENEAKQSKDILLLDFQDSYKNLATKLIHSLIWIHDNLNSVKYVIKCDDDSFVRVDLLVKELDAFAPDMNVQSLQKYVTFKNKGPFQGLYWGYFDGRAHVYLNGKWQEQDWFLCDNYLPYALGGGYVISKSIVDYVARNHNFLSYYNSEDVSMGVWTAALSGINRVHDTRFDTEWKSRGCRDDLLVRHKQTPSDMFQMYRTLVHSQGENLCKNENNERLPYFYKWHVLPSKCCR